MRISDWSSDVCSSDLLAAQESRNIQQVLLRLAVADALGRVEGETRLGGASGCPGGRPRGRTAGRGLSRGLTLRLGRDRKSVVYGKSVSVRVDLGGRRIIKNKRQYTTDSHIPHPTCTRHHRTRQQKQ